MASGKSLVRTMCHFNKLFLSGRTPKLYQSNLTQLLSPTSTISSSAICKEADTEPGQEVDKKADSELEKLLAEKDKLLEESRKETSDFKDKYYRSLAEGENIRRRGTKQVSDAKLYAIQGLAKDLLEVADVLETATSSVPQEECVKNKYLKELFDGVSMTETELQKVFKKHGIEKVHPIDETFDPNFHEALFQLPFEGKSSGTVAIVEKVGYKLHGRALRAAQVGVVL